MAIRTGDHDGSLGKPHRARQGLVLVVEGDSGTRDLVRKTLQKDYELVSLADGQEFMDAVEAYNPDLIILVSGLPKRQLDGYELYQQLRGHAQFRDIPVLMLSTACANAAFMKSLVMHGDAYLIKPFAQKTLWDVATKLIAATL